MLSGSAAVLPTFPAPTASTASSARANAAATTSVGSNTWSLAGQTLTGSNTLKIKVSDAAGNDGTVSSQAYVLDTTAPTAHSAPDMTSGTDSGSSNSDNITKTYW